MKKNELKKDEVILATIHQKPNRFIWWIVISILVIAATITYLIAVYDNGDKLFNILFIIFICLITVVLGFKCFNLIKKYIVNEYVITNQRIYVNEFLFIGRRKSELRYSYILDIKIINNELFKTYNLELYTKKQNVTFHDVTNKDVSLAIDSISKEDCDFIMKAINKYAK